MFSPQVRFVNARWLYKKRRRGLCNLKLQSWLQHHLLRMSRNPICQNSTFSSQAATGAALIFQHVNIIASLTNGVEQIGLKVSDYGTHSLRRTKVAQLYRNTGNLRAVQLLLGHAKDRKHNSLPWYWAGRRPANIRSSRDLKCDFIQISKVHNAPFEKKRQRLILGDLRLPSQRLTWGVTPS